MDDTNAIATVEISPDTIEQSGDFIGQWNGLISTTNWEKGAIITEWRNSLQEEGSARSQYSDEAWSKLVGGVSPQHVGRLRRTTDRFGDSYTTYKGLYWSHFYAALDWDDAEMWLEGAVQSDWSVSQMRTKRWETLGKIPAEKPRRSDIVSAETTEEDAVLAMGDKVVTASDREFIEGPAPEGPDFGDEQEPGHESRRSKAVPSATESEPAPAARPVRLFESFKDLPDDIQAATDQFKIAIIRHKAAGWEDISRDDLLDLLTALGALARTEI